MDPSWEFQAPQFVDFNNLERAEDKKADDFFNVDMESGELWTTALEEAETSVIDTDYHFFTEVGLSRIDHLPQPASAQTHCQNCLSSDHQDFSIGMQE